MYKYKHIIMLRYYLEDIYTLLYLLVYISISSHLFYCYPVALGPKHITTHIVLYITSIHHITYITHITYLEYITAIIIIIIIIMKL